MKKEKGAEGREGPGAERNGKERCKGEKATSRGKDYLLERP